MSSRFRLLRSVASFALAVVALSITACGGGDDDDGPVDAGPERDLNTLATCDPSDGTITGDCQHFACLYRNASLTLCPGTTTLSFFCTGVADFPADYQTAIRPYLTQCGESLDEIVDTEVETTDGPATIAACDILKCVAKPESMRLFMGGPNILADCAPVPAPACDFPDPPPAAP